MSFENLKLNILGCELSPSCPVADYYTLEDGGSAQSSDTQDPSAKGVDDATAENADAGAAAGAAAAGSGDVYAQPEPGRGSQDLTTSPDPPSASGGGNNDDLTKTVDPSTSQISTSGRPDEKTKEIKSALDID